MLSRLDEQTLVGRKHVTRQQLPDLAAYGCGSSGGLSDLGAELMVGLLLAPAVDGRAVLLPGG